jgi:hypothetical protein
VPAAVVLIVAVQLIDAPPAAGDADPSTGAWLALGAGLLMAAGSALSLAEISVTVQVRERELRRRMAVVDRRGDAADGPVEPLAGAEPEGDPQRTQPFGAIEDPGPAEEGRA